MFDLFLYMWNITTSSTFYLFLLDFDSRLGSIPISRLSRNVLTFSSGTCKVTFFNVYISGSFGINLDVQYK